MQVQNSQMAPNQQQRSKNFFDNNPLMQRARLMAQGKSEQELMQIAQNLCAQRGIDLNQAYQAFRTQFNLGAK